MLTKTIAATAALAMLMAGGQAIAAQKKAPSPSAAPKQPIPYSQLDAYAKATPKIRASKDWWAGQAQTGMSTDTSATASTNAEASPALPPSTSTTPETSANAPPSTQSPSPSVTPPINEPAIEEKTESSAPGAPASPPADTPADPK
ncbi:hypothetical protein [Caulobacter segnis]